MRQCEGSFLNFEMRFRFGGAGVVLERKGLPFTFNGTISSTGSGDFDLAFFLRSNMADLALLLREVKMTRLVVVDDKYGRDSIDFPVSLLCNHII